MSISAAIFDFDDTVVATFRTRTLTLRAVAADLGQEITDAALRKHWGKPFDQLLDAVAPLIEYDVFYSAYKEAMLKNRPLVLPGVNNLLRILFKQEIPIFIVSSGSHALVQQDLQESGLWQYITKLWAFEDTPFHKPDPRTLEPVLKTLQELGCDDISQAFYVGDSVIDYRIASSHNVTFFAALTGINSRHDFIKAGMDSSKIACNVDELFEFPLIRSLYEAEAGGKAP